MRLPTSIRIGRSWCVNSQAQVASFTASTPFLSSECGLVARITPGHSMYRVGLVANSAIADTPRWHPQACLEPSMLWPARCRPRNCAARSAAPLGCMAASSGIFLASMARPSESGIDQTRVKFQRMAEFIDRFIIFPFQKQNLAQQRLQCGVAAGGNADRLLAFSLRCGQLVMVHQKCRVIGVAEKIGIRHRDMREEGLVVSPILELQGSDHATAGQSHAENPCKNRPGILRCRRQSYASQQIRTNKPIERIYM